MRIENLLKRGLVEYEEVDQLQREIWTAVRDGIQDHTLLVAQFEPTYTMRCNTHEVDLLNKELPVIRTDRAGSLTWHGPGQLVIYPLVKLREPVDLIAYIRTVEAAVVDAVRDTQDVPAETIKGRAGVWMRYRDVVGCIAVQRGAGRDRKLCAIGLKVVQATTLHGLALNINPDFSNAFTEIIPRGLADAGVISLFEEGAYPAMNQAAAVTTGQLAKKLQPLLATGTS